MIVSIVLLLLFVLITIMIITIIIVIFNHYYLKDHMWKAESGKAALDTPQPAFSL